MLLGILGLVVSPFLPFKNLPKSFAVVSGSMEPAIKTGSIVFTHTVDLKTIKKGDIIAFTSPSNSKDTILHRVDSIKTTEPLTFSTKGDANNSPDAWDVMDVGVKGVYFGAIPFLGYVAAFVKKPLGFGIIVGIPALLFIISQIFNIKKAIAEEVDRKVAKVLETKKKTKPIENNLKSLILFIVLFTSLSGLSILQAIKASFNSVVTISGISLSVVDFIPPSTPTGLRYLSPTVACGGATNSYTITPDWNDSTAHGSKYIDHYEYESFNPPGGWMWGPINVSASQITGAFTVGEGTYGFRIRAVDNLGYVSDWTSVDFATSCQITYSLPTTPTPSLISPANNSVVKVHDFMFDWSDVTALTAVTYDWEGSTVNDFSSGGMWNHYGLTASNVYSPGTPDNVYYWHVRACDAASNCSPWTEVWKMTVDTKAPAVPTGIYFKDTVNNKNVACGGITSARNFDVYWDANTETDFDHYEYTSYNADGNTGLVDQPFTTPYFNASWWTVPIEGTYGVQIRAVDMAGNKSDWSGGAESFNNSCKYTTDWTAPTVDLIFPTPGPTSTYFTVVFSEDVNKVDAENPANYFLNNWPGAEGSGNLVGHATVLYNSTSYTATITFTTPGWYISPEQKWGVQNIHDLANNLLQVNPYAEYSTPLVKPVTTDSGTDSNWHNSPVTVNFSCTDINGSGCKATYYTTDGSDPTTASSSGNSVTLNTDGIFTIKYFSVDNAGNIEDVKTAANTVKIDKTAPVSVITGPVSSNNNHADISISSWDGKIEGTATDSLSGIDRIEISIQKDSDKFWSGTDWISGSESSTRVLTTGTTSWSYQISGTVPSGLYKIISHAIDKAGNEENSAIIEFNNEDFITPTPSDTPTPVGSPTPEATDSAVQTLTPTDDPSPTPTPILTTETTPTPTPTDTPEVTPSPTDSPTDTSTSTPAPSPTPAPTDSI